MTQISDVIASLHGQTAVVEQVVDRLRAANRRMTGSNGAQPPKQGTAGPASSPEQPPLLSSLDRAVEDLRHANNDLLDEVAYLEQYTETGPVPSGSQIPYSKAA